MGDGGTGDWGHPGRPRKVTCEDVYEATEKARGPVISTEIAEVLDVSYQAVGKRLDELPAEGRLERKELGGVTSYWIPDD